MNRAVFAAIAFASFTGMLVPLVPAGAEPPGARRLPINVRIPDDFAAILKATATATQPQSRPPRPGSPATMLDDAARRPGKQLPMQAGKAKAFRIDIPRGWTIRSDELNYAVVNDAKSAAPEYSMGFVRYKYAVPGTAPGKDAVGLAPVAYRDPPAALARSLASSGIARDVQIIAECPGTDLPVEKSKLYTWAVVFGKVDLRVVHVRFTNALTGKAERGLYIVSCLAVRSGDMWELWVDGGYAPADELDDYLPLFARMKASFHTDLEWFAAGFNALQARSRQEELARQRQREEAERARLAREAYQDSLREAGRIREYEDWRASQATWGQRSWVAINNGNKVYTTDRYGISGPEGRASGDRFSTQYFHGRTPWGEFVTPVDTYEQWRRYISRGR